MKRNRILVLAGSFLLMLSLLPIGCGGGGGGNGSSNSMPTPALYVGGETYDFGAATLGNAVTLPVTVGDSGTGDLSVTAVTLSDSENFSIDPGGCGTAPFTVAAGGECTLFVTFAPKTVGNYGETLSIASNDAGEPTCILNLVGTGVAVTQLTVSLNRIDTDCSTVTSYVSVTDQEGFVVSGLQAADFILTDNAEEQTLNSVDFAGSFPMSAAILMDYSGSILSVPGLSADIEDAVINFIGEMAELDQAEIIKFGTTVQLMQPFTTDKNLLETAILAPPAVGTATALYDAVYKGIEDAALTTTHTRAVIVLTDGFDMGDPRTTPGSVKTIEEVIALAQKERVPVFTIGLGLDTKPELLQQIAAETGGQYFDALNADYLKTIYLKLSNNLKNQYVLNYTPPARGAGTDVSVIVTVSDDIPEAGVFGDFSQLNYTSCR